MNKKLCIMLMCMIIPFFAFSQDSGDASGLENNGFYQYTQGLIGLDVIVSFANIDYSIKGKVLEAYPDGIVITTFMKEEVFIRREAIAYIQVKKVNK